MELTKEQVAIINSTGNIKINAVAGSGKTTTVIEYARTRPKSSSILYIAFNKSVKLEAVKKFAEKGLDNVTVETAHSLAHRYIVRGSIYTVRKQAYKTNEIVELLGLQGGKEKHTEYVIANHINKFITYFCNSDKSKTEELNYLDIVSDEKARAFVKTFYDYIKAQTRLLLKKMNDGKIEIIHDFYLKKFQLSGQQLNYDYILFDEGQDASAAMLDIFLKQRATKVIVGDTHQQIYGWRFAVNSLEKVGFTTYHLSTSFRFAQDIAGLAMGVLQLKTHIDEHYQPITIQGKGSNKGVKSKAILARTNLGLLLKAIEFITEHKKVKDIYFEGNINSYTYADDGASLFDVLNLYNSKFSLIRDKLIKGMKDLDELEDYIEKTEDVQLGLMVEIVKEYGDEIPGILKTLKDKHVENDDKDKAEMVFSTVHRCKGMEYDSVQLVNDFITEAKLEKQQSGKSPEEVNIAKLNEEINLLYVAVTRTKNALYIPEEMMPADFPDSPRIHVIPKEVTESKTTTTPTTKRAPKKETPKAYSVERFRQDHKDAYEPWTNDADSDLTIMYADGISLKEIAEHFGRTRGAIIARIKKLEIEDLNR